MKIIIESYKGEDEELIVSAEFPGATIYEVLQNLQGLLVAAGFHPDSVKDGFINTANELEDQLGEKK